MAAVLARTALGAILMAGSGVSGAHGQAMSSEEEQNLIRRELRKDSNLYFVGCDGYGAPTPAGDGMTVAAHFELRDSNGRLIVAGTPSLESGGGDTLRRTPAFGALGIADCGAALSDLQTLPTFWMRRVSLLRARALHRYAAGDAAGADADLDQAEAAGQPADPFYARSLGLSLKLERAFLLSRAGRQAEAEATAVAAWGQRPWSRQATYAAIVAVGPAASAQTLSTLRRRYAALDPGSAGPPGFGVPDLPKRLKPPAEPTDTADAAGLYDVLPEPETNARIAIDPDAPVDAPPSDAPGSGAWVSFGGRYATLAIAEEGALLRAAEAVRSQGSGAFAVTARRDLWRLLGRSQARCYASTPVAEARVPCREVWTGGFHTDIRVTPQTPTGADDDRDLPADTIIAALEPVYGPTP